MYNIFEEIGEEFHNAKLDKLDFPDDIMEKILSWSIKPIGIFYFASNPGVGKTYLTGAFLNEWKKRKLFCRRFDERGLLAYLRLAHKEGHDYCYSLRNLCECQYFILDDLGTCKDSEWQKEILFDLIDTRWSSRKPTIITSNLSISELEERYEERLVSRLKDVRNLCIQIHGHDRRQIESV